MKASKRKFNEFKRDIELKIAHIPADARNLDNETSNKVERIVRANDLKMLIIHRIKDSNTSPKTLLYSLARRLDEEQRHRDPHRAVETKEDQLLETDISSETARFGT